jgi:hypothetical protein
MDLLGPANDDSFGSQRARSVPVLSSMSTVRGYPSKLKIFRIRGSRFWQVRCYIEGRMYVRSTRSEQKLNAVEFAKLFYDELLIRHRTSGDHDIKHGPQFLLAYFLLRLLNAPLKQSAGVCYAGNCHFNHSRRYAVACRNRFAQCSANSILDPLRTRTCSNLLMV